MNATCAQCAAFRLVDPGMRGIVGVGECHLRGPVLPHYEKATRPWPRVREDDFCMELVPKPAQEKR